MDNRNGKRPMDEKMKIPSSNQVKKVRQLKIENPQDFATGKALGCNAGSSSSSGNVHLSSKENMQKKTNNMVLSNNLMPEIKDVINGYGKKRWREICCGIYFFSVISLYEHTKRCHTKKEAVCSRSRDPINLIAASLPGCSVKAKRSERNSEGFKEVKAALTLMCMYYNERKKIIQSTKTSPPSINYINRESFKNPLLRWPTIDERKKCLKGKAAASSEKKMKKRSPNKSLTNIKTTGYNSSSSSPEENYKCDDCSKAYPTFQALGGHRSIHNKPKNSSKRTKKEANRIVRTNFPHQYQCTVCRQFFPTGQALGGHKRGHLFVQYENNYEDGSPLKKMRNEPEMWEEEEDLQ